MKAIVNVKQASFYSKFNGLTFEVEEVLSNQVCLKIPENGRFIDVDFSFKEVVIVDFQSEFFESRGTLRERLFFYMKDNKISAETIFETIK